MLAPADPAVKVLVVRAPVWLLSAEGPLYTRIILFPLQCSVGVLIYVQVSIQHSGRVQIYLVFLMGI